MLFSVVSAIMETCLAWTSEQGSFPFVYAAIGERDDEDHMKGAYISNATVVEPSDFVISDEREPTISGECVQAIIQSAA
jgi:retinol dehydrogenase-12